MSLASFVFHSPGPSAITDTFNNFELEANFWYSPYLEATQGIFNEAASNILMFDFDRLKEFSATGAKEISHCQLAQLAANSAIGTKYLCLTRSPKASNSAGIFCPTTSNSNS